MEDNPDNGSSLPFGELREITLLIPGEHFFCESISCSEDVEDQDLEELVYRAKQSKIRCSSQAMTHWLMKTGWAH